MSRSLLLWWLAAGLLAGLVAGTVAFVGAEPRLDEAIALEQAAAPAAAAEDPLVSRAGQRAGLVFAWALAGLAVGFLFALAF
ncbi:MAG TPA: CbtA family protein, partial [Solirubrobacteraceae bacterium]|nr:CbtA family protein [Solirubrobacteraceae bacterium]